MIISRSKRKMEEHFKEKALVRLGLHVNDEQIRDVVKQIQGGDETFHEAQSNRRKIHLVTVRGTPDAPGWPEEVEAYVAYDTVHSTVVTCGKFLAQRNGEWIWH